jgi:pyruvate/2-oxoglutarate dehydrogenase complex dihydrolipoamide dehydrogenase (E3) component
VLGPGRVRVEGPEGVQEIACKTLVLATGSRPASFPGLAPDGAAVLDSDGFLGLTAMPASLLVVGAGFIGLEMAQAAHRFGCAVTLVDALDRVAAQEDPEVSAALLSQCKRWKWNVRLGVRVTSLTTEDNRAVLRLDSGETLGADKALIAVGRRPNSADLGRVRPRASRWGSRTWSLASSPWPPLAGPRAGAAVTIRINSTISGASSATLFSNCRALLMVASGRVVIIRGQA